MEHVQADLDRRMRLLPLALPIFVESALRSLFGSVDVLMISRYDESAVGAVGTANQLTVFVMLVYTVIAMGTGIVISQNLGARRGKRAADSAAMALIVNLAVGALMSVALSSLAGPLLSVFNLPEAAAGYATTFLSTVGAFSVCVAGSGAVGQILRNYGHTRQVMFINLAAVCLNVLGNFLCLYGPLGFPKLGIQGVALSTGVSQTLAFLVGLLVLRKKVPIGGALRGLPALPRGEAPSILRDILRIGLPSAGEFMSYNMAQIVVTLAITNFMVPLWPDALNARTILMTIINYLVLCTGAIANASGTIVGYRIGAGRMDEAYKTAIRNLKLAMGVSLSVACVMAFASPLVLGLFTTSQWIVQTGSMLLLFNILQEPGRCLNLVIGYSIRGAGDARYILVLGLVGQWLMLVGLTYLLGVALGLGLLGMWIAMSVDEWVRGLFMLARWRSRKWIGKRIVKDAPLSEPMEA